MKSGPTSNASTTNGGTDDPTKTTKRNAASRGSEKLVTAQHVQASSGGGPGDGAGDSRPVGEANAQGDSGHLRPNGNGLGGPPIPTLGTIEAWAKQAREAGIPDEFNRFNGTAPEELADNEKRKARVMKQTQDPLAPRREKKGKPKSALDLPKSVEPEGLALRNQMRKDAEAQKKQRLRDLREQTQTRLTAKKGSTAMLTKTGTKEAALQAARERHLADVEKATTPKPLQATAKAKGKGSKAKAPKAPKAAKAAPKATAKAAAKAPKEGQSKTDVAVKMLMKGATRLQIAEAVDWPSINLKPIAKRRGLKLVEGKDGVIHAHAS